MTNKVLRNVGYWKTEEHLDYPEPADLIDFSWSEASRCDVANYLTHGLIAGSWAGIAKCRICKTSLGFRDLSDGVFVWPEGLDHYVLVHAVRLPEEFLLHINSVSDALDEAKRTSDWWIEQTRAKT